MIRAGRDTDIPALLELGREFVAESPRYSRFTYSEERTRWGLEHCLDHGFLEVIDVDGQVIGALVGAIGPHWFSENTCASDLAFFIRKNMRGGSSALRLARNFIDWAKSKGAHEVQIANSAGIATEQLERLLHAAGFTTVGPICVRQF